MFIIISINNILKVAAVVVVVVVVVRWSGGGPGCESRHWARFQSCGGTFNV